MDLKRAILERVSRRSYESTPVDELMLEKLEAAVWECNRTGGLNIKVVVNDPEPFTTKGTYGMISGASNYIAMIAPDDDPHGDEKLGYYGESLVLLLTSLDIGTCWVASTYDKDACRLSVPDGNSLRLIIVFGNVKIHETLKEKAIAKAVKREGKEIKDMLKSYDKVANWAVDGVRYAIKAPSAKNRQPVKFFCSEEAAFAKVPCEHEYDLVDLGIAKLHFEVGADGGTWEFGNGALFTKTE